MPETFEDLTIEQLTDRMREYYAEHLGDAEVVKS
jgi:hypothetical protein